MSEIYVLIGERGGNDDYTTTVLGTFSSAQAARDAIPAVVAHGKEQYAKYTEWHTKYVDHWSRLEVAFPWSDLVQERKRAEIIATIGPEPRFTCEDEAYIIQRHVLDGIGVGEVVEEQSPPPVQGQPTKDSQQGE